MVLCSKDVALKQFLGDYKHESALVMHWVIVGPSHQETRPQEGGVLRAYRECQTQPSNVVKSIVNTFFLANMASNPHTFEYRCEVLPSRWAATQTAVPCDRYHRHCFVVLGSFDGVPLVFVLCTACVVHGVRRYVCCLHRLRCTVKSPCGTVSACHHPQQQT